MMGILIIAGHLDQGSILNTLVNRLSQASHRCTVAIFLQVKDNRL